ncbi:poly-gamma-glutamate hydrolase family protein [Mycolicibacterium thermoresistibile]
MMGVRHAYFAYGSNLCVQQMARRCPGACDPRPAVLPDHDWLINQRGVATVEPSTGARVHGVLWHVTDTDLATLDSAEGVPVRYRRDRLTVQLGDGAAEAWVYIDHRVEPGPPRPGYLERIIDGALHHGLPQRWIGFLQRWDPDRYPHHLPSARYDPADSPRLAEFLDHVDVGVSLHGYGRIGRSTELLVGGRNRSLAVHLARNVRIPGYRLVTDLAAIPRELRGQHPDNPVNRPARGGAQLELSARVRGISPRSPLPGDDGLTAPAWELIEGLVAAARSWPLPA